MPQSREYELALAIIYADDGSKTDDAEHSPACWSRGKEVSLPHKTSCMNSFPARSQRDRWTFQERGKNKARHKHSRRSQAKKNRVAKSTSTLHRRLQGQAGATRKRSGEANICLLCRNNMHIQLCSMSASDSFFIRMWRRAGWDSLFKTAKERRYVWKEKRVGNVEEVHFYMRKYQNCNGEKTTTSTGCDSRTANYQSGPTTHPM